MISDHVAQIAREMNLSLSRVSATAKLLEEGATVPFVARYRKELTGSMDEVQISAIRDRMEQLRDLDLRRRTILQTLESAGQLTDALKNAIARAGTMTELEDIYAPYKPKRRTRAMVARERGLEALADFILKNQDADPEIEAAAFVDPAKEVPDLASALAGARDIIAEQIAEDKTARERCRELYEKYAVLRSEVYKGKEAEAANYKDYFEWSENLAGAPSHRILAIRRGEREGFLFFRITVDENEALARLGKIFVTGTGGAAAQVKMALEDSWRRLLSPSLETEARLASKNRADAVAIKVFADNVSEMLMAPAVGQKNTLALDPGFRTGCKLVVLDAQGKLLYHTVIFPTAGSARQYEEAAADLRRLCAEYKVEAIAIGNGTASRETEAFVRKSGVPATIPVVVVSESGASIYSASEVAREEFPDQDITVRGAVSIGRRMMDPLAELVKLDPKSIGVGQYQHDVNQILLKKSLDDVVVSCVNKVGVEVNTASKQLLTYVSGLNAGIAANIVAYRNEHGPFRSRRELLNVPRLGEKAFEQCAGFLRIRGGNEPLDASAVHPESYPLVEAMAQDLGVDVKTLLSDAKTRSRICLEKYVSPTAGLPTLQDILRELEKPGRDPRQKFEAFAFAEGVAAIEDLAPGMQLPGIVSNVANFGAFVDIGVHQDGLVHVSQLADFFVSNPADVVKVGQRVTVTVLEVDRERRRISLSMKSRPEAGTSRSRKTQTRGNGNRNSAGASDEKFGNNPFGSLGDIFK
ncbi:MAG: RNA-binding transcriptional accessory protein [Opitutales bacterium]|nr:RNA-binding transcriptional accessory protein [Opitutales bacterium]